MIWHGMITPWAGLTFNNNARLVVVHIGNRGSVSTCYP
jgi:hypothetical protein